MAEGTARRSRLFRLALVVVAVIVVAAVAVLLVRSAGGGDTAGAPGPSVGSTAPTTGSATPDSASPSASAAAPPPTAAASSPSPATSSATAGDPGEPAPTSAASTKSPVPLDEPNEVERGLTAEVTKLEAVAGEARGPGEIAGPALRATITLTNGSDAPIDLSTTVVNLYYGSDETPASTLSGPGTAALPDRVQSGKKASGRFVFGVPTRERGEVLITVDYSVRTPVVAFRGRAPR